MKKVLILSSFLLLGCVNNHDLQINNQVQKINKDKFLMKKYQITSDNLIKLDNEYLFFKPSVNGTDIYILNSKYKLEDKFTTPMLLDAKQLKVYKDKIYLFGVDQEKYYPLLLIFNKNGKLIKKYEIPKKYALAKDFFVDGNNIYFIIDVYKNGKSEIEIYKNGKIYKKIDLKNSINGNYIFKFDKDIFLIGTIKNKTQDAFIINLSKGWIRIFDFGMDDSVIKVKPKKKVLELTILSTDEMGADEYYDIILDINGKILKNKCKIKFQKLPSKFRT